MTAWGVIHTRTKQEKRADLNLRRQGYETCLPMITRSKRSARKITTGSEPMFPGYIFISLDREGQNFAPISGTFGVKYLITDGGAPSQLPTGFVDAIRQTEGKADAFGPTASPVAIGDTVRIAVGPFVDCLANVHELLPGDRVKLLMSVLGGGTTAVLPRESLEPAN